MRRSRKREERPGGRPERSESNEQPCKPLSRDDVSQLNIDVNPDDRLLIDGFGCIHSRTVLRRWPDTLKTAMKLRFVDAAELEGAHVAR